MATQHPQQPFNEQRWQLLKNTGGYDIPPYSIVELVGAYQLEEGRTVMTCQRVSSDGPLKTAVNGPMTLVAGGKPQPGTLDYPTYVRYSGTIPENLTEVGPSKDTFTVKSGKTGFIVVGDQTVKNGITLLYIEERPVAGTSGRMAVVTQTVDARTGSGPYTVGTGKVEFFNFTDGDTLTQDTATQYDVLNWSGVTFPVDRFLWVQEDTSGNWWVVSADCP